VHRRYPGGVVINAAEVRISVANRLLLRCIAMAGPGLQTPMCSGRQGYGCAGLGEEVSAAYEAMLAVIRMIRVRAYIISFDSKGRRHWARHRPSRSNRGKIHESGCPLTPLPGGRYLGMQGREAAVEVSSGNYELAVDANAVARALSFAEH